jgi:heavy-metal resistance protein
MRRWWLVIALLLSVGLNVGIFGVIVLRRLGPAVRKPKPPAEMANPAADPLPRLPRLADRLGLEGEERRRFLDVQWNLFQETSHLRLQLGEVHRALRRELARPTPDKAEVDRLLAESSRIYLALEQALVNNVLATRELLGPDKEEEYLRLIRQIRVPNPIGLGGGKNPGAPPNRPGARLRQRWQQRQERLRERFPEPEPRNPPP